MIQRIRMPCLLCRVENDFIYNSKKYLKCSNCQNEFHYDESLDSYITILGIRRDILERIFNEQ